MPNFYRDTCNEPNCYCQNIGIKPCKYTTTSVCFGIIDDLTNENEPAFIQEFKPDEWDVTVMKEGKENYEVTFKAIDKCLSFPPPQNPLEENMICEGMLYFNDHLYFVEIKNWTDSKYSDKAISQLSRSIRVFSENHDLDIYNHRRAYISNKAKPNPPEAKGSTKDRFGDEHFDFDLIWSTDIKLP